MKPVKYIFLSSSSKGRNLKYYDLNSDDFFVGSWAGLFARRLKKYKPDLDILIWRIEPVVRKPLIKNVYNLNGVIWPYKGILIKNILSLAMYLTILKLSFKYKLIIHYHSLFDRFILLRFILPPNIKIILSHHGGVPPVKGSLKDFLFRLTYRYASGITYLSSKVREYLKTAKVPANKIYFLPVGADFKLFYPSDKRVARQKLGLNQNIVYGIYVGSFYRLKSVDKILDIISSLRDKYNFSVIFVGGEDNESNDLYTEVVKSGCPYFGRQVWTQMPDFYNAADFYIHPTFNPHFGGLDVTWIEALACNIPVLSPQLKYLDFDYSDLGVAINKPEEGIERTEFMIKNYMKYTKCREVAIEQLDANSAILNRLSMIYEKVISK